MKPKFAKWRNALSKMQGDSIGINLLLTRKCNLTCDHCMYASSPKMSDNWMTFEDLRSIETFCDQLDELDVRPMINLVGGEPTLDLNQFERILRDVVQWDYPIEMTTNGWWLEDAEAFVRFARIIGGAPFLNIRISNTIWHKRGKHFPKDHKELESYLEDIASHVGETPKCDTCDGELSYSIGSDNCEYTCEKKCEPISQEDYHDKEAMLNDRLYGAAQSLLEVIENHDLYLDRRIDSTEKISPVGRARMYNMGSQDGACHPTQDMKFTFMPGSPGGTPAPLYDACCNGGKLPLGNACDGALTLLALRHDYMKALHKEIPITYSSTAANNYNPGGGIRCHGCASFGAKWTRENIPSLRPKAAKFHAIIFNELKEINERAEEADSVLHS